jgi:hypothetical protein
MVGADELQLTLNGFRVEVGATHGDGELGGMVLGQAPSRAIDASDFPGEVIEGASEVVNNISYNEAPAEWWCFGHCLCEKIDMSFLRIELSRHSYEVSTRFGVSHPVRNVFVEGIRMFFRPLDLRPASSNRISHEP